MSQTTVSPASPNGVDAKIDKQAKLMVANDPTHTLSYAEAVSLLQGQQSSSSATGIPDGYINLGNGWNAGTTTGEDRRQAEAEGARRPGNVYSPGDVVRNTSDESSDWLVQHYYANDDTWKRIYGEMIAAGELKPGATITDALTVWGKYSYIANAAGYLRGSTLTPEDYLRAHPNNGGGSTTTHHTETSTDSTVSNIRDLEAGYQDAAHQYLGRRATEAEAAAAGAKAQSAERANPATRTTKSTTVTNNTTGNSNTSSSSSGVSGLGSAAINDLYAQQAMATPDYAEYQAGGQILPTIMNAISAVVAGVPNG